MIPEFVSFRLAALGGIIRGMDRKRKKALTACLAFIAIFVAAWCSTVLWINMPWRMVVQVPLLLTVPGTAFLIRRWIFDR